MHYARWHKHGDPLVVKRANVRPAADRFWEKVDKRGPNECWLWMGTAMGKGYGQFHRGVGLGATPAHRWSYEQEFGPVPEGMQLDHVAARGCSSKLCVNPAHLEVVTNRVNSLRSNNVGAINAAKTHCAQGHPLDGDVRVVRNGDNIRRICRICERESGRRYKARIRGQH